MFNDNKTEVQRYIEEQKQISERNRLAKLLKMYPNTPDFTQMSLQDEINARFDLDELEQLKQKYPSVPTSMPSTNNSGMLDNVVHNWAAPSVQNAYEKAKEYSQKQYNHISDTDKHRYISCIGASDGLLAATETLGGAVMKERKGLIYITNSQTRHKEQDMAEH